MIDRNTLIPFLVASAVLVLIPGPAMMYIVSTGISRGRKTAFASVFGIETGAMVHVAAAAIGASAVIASSAVAFSILKYAGTLYLFYLGWKTLRSPHPTLHTVAPTEPSPWRSFGRGVLVNALNPKVALFFLAFIPQFVDPDRGQMGLQFLVLGAFFIGVAFFIDTSYALASSAIGRLVARSSRFATMQKRFAGIAYITLGASAALTGNAND